MKTTVALLALLLAAAPVVAEPPVREVFGRKYDVVQLAPGVYSMIWREVIAGPVALGHCTFIVNDDDVIVIDPTSVLAGARAVLAEIRAVTSKPVRYVISTHWHEDHVFGAQVLLEAFPGAELIAHTMTRRDFIEKDIPFVKNDLIAQAERIKRAESMELTDAQKQRLEVYRELYADMSAVRFVPPTLLVTHSLSLIRGARTIDLLYLGRANTRGDLVIVLPNEKIAISGDLAITPQQWALESYIGDWIGTLDRLAALPVATYVPGHGPPQHDRVFITTIRDALRSIRTQVEAGIREKKPLAELLKTVDVKSYRALSGADRDGMAKDWYDEYFIKPAIERSYEELTTGYPD